MKQTIIFIKYSPLTEKVYEDFCMSDLVREGYHVEYWDVTPLYFFILDSVEHYYSEKIKIVRVQNYNQLKLMAKQHKHSLYISLMTPGLNQVKILRALANNDSIISFWGPSPVFYKQNSVSKRIRRVTWSKLIWFMKHCICRMFFSKLVIQNYDYYFNVGEKGYQSLGSIDEKSKKKIKKLNVNSFDYNKYIYSRESTNSSFEENYILFIDQYYPFHPDMTISGFKHIPYKPYYEQLNHVFKQFEQNLRMKIIIAAHPKSLKYKNEDYFDGRKVYWGKTAELTKAASYIITHDSTAISFAIMTHKPVIILTSSLISKYYPVNYNNCINLSEEFGFRLVNMDVQESVLLVTHENLKLSSKQIDKYNSFVYGYCTSPSLHESNSELLVHYIKNLFYRG